MARLLADENFPFRVVEELRRLGHDVVTMVDMGRANEGLSDESVLALAGDARRAVVTLNRRDFIRLHGTHPDHAGIVVCTRDEDVGSFAARIHAAIVDLPSIDGTLVRVTRVPR